MADKVKSTQPPIRRDAGQSGREALEALSDRVMQDAGVVCGCLGLAFGVGFARFLPSGGLVMILAILFPLGILWFFLRFRPACIEAQQRRQGILGERKVASWLARMSRDGHHVFHDVVADNFNIDHVVVGPRGLYCIETKTSSRPATDRVVYDGERIRIGSGPITDAPLRQVAANAHWLAKRLETLTGRNFPVKTAVLYPDRPTEMSRRECWKTHWVLTPEAFITSVRRERQGLPDADVQLIAEMLDTMTRIAQECDRIKVNA